MKRKLIWTEEELAQGSEAWFEWRKGGGETEMTLGGSEIAPLMYMSPYATPLDVFNWKLGIEEKQFSDTAVEAMSRGTRLEPLARKHYASTFRQEVRTLCAMHPEKPWMRTSLDGITEDNRVILEIKSPKNLDNHTKQTKGGKLPAYRYPQLQWQLAVMREHFPEVERVDYISFYVDENDEGEVTFTDMHVIPVYPNEAFIEEVMYRAEYFVNRHLIPRVPPPPTIFLDRSPFVVRYPKPKMKKGEYWYPGMVPRI